MKKIELAVLLATYNGAKYLVEQLDSLRAQTYQDFICYIHDDGSNDGTQQIITEYCNRYPAHFVYLGCSRTGGPKYNFMYLLKEVEANYYMFCDQDDVWKPEKIEKSYSTLQKLEVNAHSPACIFSDLSVVDANLNIVSASFYKYTKRNPHKLSINDMLYDNLAYGCTIMFNAPIRNIILNVNVVEYVHMHDVFPSYIASALGKLKFIDVPLMLYRRHDKTVSTTTKARTLSQNIKRLIKVVSPSKISIWFVNRKAWLRIRQNDAIAILTCIEAYIENLQSKDSLSNDEVELFARAKASTTVLRKFISQLEGSLLINQIRLYYWKCMM